MRLETVIYNTFDNSSAQRVKPANREAGEAGTRWEERTRNRDEEELFNSRPLSGRQDAEGEERDPGFREGHVAEDGQSLLKRFEAAIREMNREAEMNYVSLRFRLHAESDRWMVSIIDVLEDEVLRVIPPEELLHLSAQIQKLTGVLVDARR